MRIAGLDFETANASAGSICAAGCAVLEDGKLVEHEEWLVKPHHSLDWVSPLCFEVHGISYFALRDAPAFPEIWPALRRLLVSADCVAIHNAAFDLRHLRAALELYQLPEVSFPYLCTLTACRAQFPELPSHSLDAMAEHFGFEFVHHDALEDAYTCARLLTRIPFPENAVREFAFSPERE